MIFNLFHRPVSSSDTYNFQRNCAHTLNLKTTILIPSDCLNNPAITDTAMKDHLEFGDEIGIWLTPLKNQPQTQIWLLSEQDKKAAVKYSVDKYTTLFGHPPKCVGNYLMDSQLIKIVKEYCPEVIAVVAGCFEEGVKVFHGCNNSWYLFSEGMSWNPWYPSKTHSLRPAGNYDDWSGVVAVPHLSRDLVLGYESRNDFFASHPANVQRGLANNGMIHEYDFNLIDQYRMQEDYNDFSYYQIHVGMQWLHQNPNLIDADEITHALYRETLEYIAKLRDSGEITDMYLSEFADYYQKNIPFTHSDIGVGKDILYGSGKQYFWLCNTDYRVLIDTFQGGSIGDLRPYVGKYEAFTGTDSPNLIYNSYPYLIQSQYRSGAKNHYEDGSRTTLLVKHHDETLDLCYYPTKIKEVTSTNYGNLLTLNPVTLIFKDGLSIELQTCYLFSKNGEIRITRKILNISDPTAILEFEEYVKGCYGHTEYPENMKGIELYIGTQKMLNYNYNDCKLTSASATDVSVFVPQINTCCTLSAISQPSEVSIKDGHLFSPFYTLTLRYHITNQIKEIQSCLTLKEMIM